MKRTIALLLAIVALAAVFTGCAKKEDPNVTRITEAYNVLGQAYYDAVYYSELAGYNYKESDEVKDQFAAWKQAVTDAKTQVTDVATYTNDQIDAAIAQMQAITAELNEFIAEYAPETEAEETTEAKAE